MIRGGEMLPGVAAEDDVGLRYVGDELENVVTSRHGAKAYFVRKKAGEIAEEAIAATALTL